MGLPGCAARPTVAGRIAMSSTTFDPEQLRPQRPLDELVPVLVGHLRPLFTVLREFHPVCRIPFQRSVLVTRYDDVAEVLRNDAAFGVPYGRKIDELAGKNFLLGLDNGAQYERDRG